MVAVDGSDSSAVNSKLISRSPGVSGMGVPRKPPKNMRERTGSPLTTIRGAPDVASTRTVRALAGVETMMMKGIAFMGWLEFPVTGETPVPRRRLVVLAVEAADDGFEPVHVIGA